MTIRVMTVGQKVKVLSGKYAGETGHIVQSRFFADHLHAGHEFIVAFNRSIGRRTFKADRLQVVVGEHS